MHKEEDQDPPIGASRTSASADSPVPIHTAPRFWPILVLLSVQGLYLVGLHALASKYPGTAAILSFDTVVLPEREVEIRVRLRSEGYPSPRSSLSGVPVFLSPEEPEEFEESSDAEASPDSKPLVWVALTNADGIASWKLKAPRKPGAHRLRAQVQSPSGEGPPITQAEVLLSVFPAESTVVLVKVPDAVLRELELPEKSPPDTSAAAEALRDVARFASIAYLLDPTWREAHRVRERLENRGFPRAPVLRPTKPSGASLNGEILRLLDLSSRRAPLWGVLRERSEVAMFVASGFRVIVLGVKDSPGFRSGSVVAAPTWADVRRTLAQ